MAYIITYTNQSLKHINQGDVACQWLYRMCTAVAPISTWPSLTHNRLPVLMMGEKNCSKYTLTPVVSFWPTNHSVRCLWELQYVHHSLQRRLTWHISDPQYTAPSLARAPLLPGPDYMTKGALQRRYKITAHSSAPVKPIAPLADTANSPQMENRLTYAKGDSSGLPLS